MTQDTKETQNTSTATAPTAEAHQNHAPSLQPPIIKVQHEESKAVCGLCDVLGSEDEVCFGDGLLCLVLMGFFLTLAF